MPVTIISSNETPFLSSKRYRKSLVTKPEDRWDGEFHVHCRRLTLPGSVNRIVEEIILYADSISSWRFTPTAKEFLIEFETSDGFRPAPKFFTRDGLTDRVRRMLLLEARDKNAKVGIGRDTKVCMFACGEVVIDETKVHINGELLHADGSFITKTADRRKGSSINLKLVREVALA